jgi:hypothetical protein
VWVARFLVVSTQPAWQRCRLHFTVVDKDGCANGVDSFATDDPRDIDRITSLVQARPTCAAMLAGQLGHAHASAASLSAISITVPLTMPPSTPRAARTSWLPAHLGGHRVHTHTHFNSCTLAIGSQRVTVQG